MTSEKLNPEVFKEMQKHERSKLAGDLQKKILASMNNSFISPQTVAWLNNMNEDVRIVGSSGQAPNVVLSAVTILDKLFDEFQRYAFQYNQNEPNNAYIISCRRPVAKGPNDEKCEGFVYNSRSAMLIVAQPNCVTLNFVAPRFVYEQEQFRTPFSPFLEFVAENVPDKQVWKLNSNNIKYAQLPTVAKKVFARLIRVSRGECNEAEALEIDFDELPEKTESRDDQLTQQPSRLDVITDLLMNLLEKVEAEIESVEAEGIKSVKKSNQETTDFLLKRSKDLREFRQKGAELARQWASVLIGD